MSLLKIKKCIVSSYIPLAYSLPGIHVSLAEELSKAADRMNLIENWKYPVLCHSGTPSSTHDPVFIFVNSAACDLFSYTRDQFIGLPSKLSAEQENRLERSKMLNDAMIKGYISDYNGTRISSQGKRFKIKNALVWTLKDEEGNHIGQATVIPSWEFLNDSQTD